MKKLFIYLGLFLLSTVIVFCGNFDISKYAVGRVRFVEGESAKLTFKEKTAKVSLDYLVLLSGTFETNKSKVEIVDLNKNIYWFDNSTFFNFESYDSMGDQTTLFLGKGAFVCSTKKPFILITGSGSVLIPENGKYEIYKPDFGKSKMEISIIEGDKPVLIKGKGLFAKIKIKKQKNFTKLVSWMEQREDDWHTTLVRLRIFSHASVMSPYIANTLANGRLSWVKVDYVKPLKRANSMIEGNAFYYKGESVLRASAIAPNLVNKFNEQELKLWFTTNKYNGIKWAWNVERGWHAEFYYEPLFEGGSSYLSIYSRDYINTLNAWLHAKQEFATFPVKKGKWYEYGDRVNNLTYRLNKGKNGVYYNNFNGGDDGTLNQNVIVKDTSKIDKEVKTINIRNNVKPIKGIIKLKQDKVVKTRMISDSLLDDERKIVKLSVKDSDVEKAKERSVNVVMPAKFPNTKPMVRPSTPGQYPVRVVKTIGVKSGK